MNNIIPNPSILETVNEQQVCEWLVAKLLSARDKMPAHALSAGAVRRRDGSYFMDWTMHTPNACVTVQNSCNDAFSELLAKVGDPVKLAAEKRAQAERLLQEAEELQPA